MFHAMPTPPSRSVGPVPSVDYERAKSKEELQAAEIEKRQQDLRCQWGVGSNYPNLPTKILCP